MLLYIYVGYPMVVALIGSLRNIQVNKGSYQPFVSIIIAARNEEQSIDGSILNKLSLDYPQDKREIIVISDDSEDKTDEIVRGYEGQGVCLLRQEPRAGKTAALNLAVPLSKGEILLFCDANSILAKDALSALVQNFNDPAVGYVTGKMVYANPKDTATGYSCSAYMKYENFLRAKETRLGSIVGVDGGIDAMRKNLYEPMNPEQLPDFVAPLKVIQKGYRVIYEPNALLTEEALPSSSKEYSMRVRVTLRALWALKDMSELLTFRYNKMFSWQLWSHKVMRYFSFIFLVGAYLGSLFARHDGPIYYALFIGQSLAYLWALGSQFVPENLRGWQPLRFITYFFLLNTASAHAFVKFLCGHKVVIWTPRIG